MRKIEAIYAHNSHFPIALQSEARPISYEKLLLIVISETLEILCAVLGRISSVISSID